MRASDVFIPSTSSRSKLGTPRKNAFIARLATGLAPLSPALESTGDLGRHLYRQARFANTARAGERHEPVASQGLP